MKNINRLFIFASVLALTISTLACGAFAPSQSAEDEPVQSLPATEAPVSAPAENETNANAVVPCAQIVPADEVKNLLINLSPTLAENSLPGTTSCVWSYANAAGQSNTFALHVDFSSNAASNCESARQSELSNEPSDTVVNSVAGLADESYVWSSKTTGLYVIYARKGDKTLIMRFVPQDILYMANESGIIDYADRIFNRFE